MNVYNIGMKGDVTIWGRTVDTPAAAHRWRFARVIEQSGYQGSIRWLS